MHITKKKISECQFRSANIEDASKIVASYISVFGEGGVRGHDHEAYPAPEVFSVAGIHKIIDDSSRDLIIGEAEGEIVSAMIVTHNSPYHREFGCVSVNQQYQGSGISSRMLTHLKILEKRTSIAINTTEIVTHSILSQAAHFQADYNKIVGFSFCQYPRVFFANNPESCLWITSLEGRIFDALRNTATNLDHSKLTSRCGAANLNATERLIFDNLQKQRQLFVPEFYKNIVVKIIKQFNDTLNYRIISEADYLLEEQPDIANNTFELDMSDDYEYAIITIGNNSAGQLEKEFKAARKKIAHRGKRYIQARVMVNEESAIRTINFLKEQGFLFLGVAPLFVLAKSNSTDDYTQNLPEFKDVFLMQWIDSTTLKQNFLPGETDSRAKLYGYPLNLTGAIVATMRNDLRQLSALRK